jgi:hypothetical protein
VRKIARIKKVPLLPFHFEVLDQMVKDGESRNDLSGIDKLFTDKANEQKNRKALETFHNTNY